MIHSPGHPVTLDQPRAERFRAGLILSGILLLFLLLGGRVLYINTVLHDRLGTMAERQQRAISRIPARRGMILDCHGRVLAATRQTPDVFVDPLAVDDLDETAARLAARLNVPAEQIVDEVRSRPGRRYVVIAREVDEVTADAVRRLNLVGVGLQRHAVRRYPMGESMAHVLGFVGRDGIGLEGLELKYNEHLRGQEGRRVTIRDARRRAIGVTGETPRPPVDGGHVVLTLDAEIQRIAEEALARTVDQFEAQSGVAIVMAPATGDVLAMAVVPGFNPNDPGSVEAGMRRNRAITDPTEPGSAFKPIIACGALDGGFVSLTEKIDCHNGVHFFGRRRVTDTSPQGLLDLTGILIHSSNIGMGTIATRMGNEVLYQTIRRFGFGDLTGLGLPGEDAGLVRPLDRWTSYSTNAVAIGYELAATPLQLITAFAAIVNDGVLLKPRLVRRLLSAEGDTMAEFVGPDPVRRVASLDTARYMVDQALLAVVEQGSTHRHIHSSYRILGKTGTAKLPFVDRRGYEPGAYVSTFVGAAPAADPQVAVLVMVRRPSAARGYYGSTVAAPAAADIITATLRYLGVPPHGADDPVALSGL